MNQVYPLVRAESRASKNERDNHLRNLMRLAQEGDGQAYAALIREIAPFLRRVIHRKWVFLQVSDVEDIVQDILLSVHSARATYDSHRPFGPWLMAICYNRVKDSARRYGRRVANEILVEELPETFPTEPENILGEGYGDAAALHGAILNLPPVQQRAVTLLKLQEMSLKEASAVSGMTISSLKTALHRAVKALRGTLKKW